jgi:hypothetical protein
MSGLSSLLAVGAVSLLAGLALGVFVEKRKAASPPSPGPSIKRALAERAAAQSAMFLKTADLVHRGDTNQALRVLVGQVDFSLVDAANTLEQSELGETAVTALQFALDHRRTNAWMGQYAPTNTMVATCMRTLLNKGRLPAGGRTQ